ncbi:MAG: hypothetical protein SPJ68_05260 [Arcanobacterium sp.]|nr:hypothetical protein [Arcanobacterium sp.]
MHPPSLISPTRRFIERRSPTPGARLTRHHIPCTKRHSSAQVPASQGGDGTGVAHHSGICITHPRQAAASHITQVLASRRITAML